MVQVVTQFGLTRVISFLLFYGIAINVLSFFLMGYDKWQARRHKKRISEKCLLGISLLGGGIGGYLAMQVFHHKTRHRYFAVCYVLTTVCWGTILLLFWKRG